MQEKDRAGKELVPQITVQGKGTLSKLQRQFNSKIERVNTLKEDMAARQAQLELARARADTELRPLMEQLVEKRVELVKLLDRSYSFSAFRKREKDKIASLIEDIAFNLIDTHGVGELIALHDKYAESPYADAVQMAREDVDTTQDILRSVFGVEVEGDELNDIEQPEDQITQPHEERAAKRQGRQKTKAQLAKEEKVKAEMNNISKASRRVYTDLVKLLHPDREQDEVARLWKEEAMKQIISAYNRDDFFELLRLRMAYIGEKESHLGQLPEDQLKYYLKLLHEQEQDLEEQQNKFLNGPDANFFEAYCGNPKQMEQKFGTAKNDLKKQLKQLKADLQNLEEPSYLRAFLKELR